MSTVSTQGKVDQYTPALKKLSCQWQPPSYVWKEGRVRTSGNKPSWCNPASGKFDVTVTPATAALLVHDYVFSLEYVSSDPGDQKTVTMFAGQSIPPALALSSTLATAASGSGQAPTSPSSLPPQ